MKNIILHFHGQFEKWENSLILHKLRFSKSHFHHGANRICELVRRLLEFSRTTSWQLIPSFARISSYYYYYLVIIIDSQKNWTAVELLILQLIEWLDLSTFRLVASSLLLSNNHWSTIVVEHLQWFDLIVTYNFKD